MERYKKSEDRNQLSLMSLCLDDMVPADAEVRALEIIIGKMDLRSLGFTHCETKETARKSYDSLDMFKLYTYSYFNGLRSSRKIERECCRNVELMWLIGKEIVAVDGSKFRASNSRLAYHSEKKIDEKIKHHAQKAEQYICTLIQ